MGLRIFLLLVTLVIRTGLGVVWVFVLGYVTLVYCTMLVFVGIPRLHVRLPLCHV